MNVKAYIAAACALTISAVPCFAGGTLGTDELVPLMSQKPAVYAALRTSLEFRDSAWAWVRFGHTYPHLTGRRLGPYEIEATVKGAGQKVVVVLCTKAKYFDKTGKRLSGDTAEDAVSVKETLAAVMLEPDTKTAQYPACPK